MSYQEALQQARERWTEGQEVEAGRLLFESLPMECRPAWATSVLNLAVKRTGIHRSDLDHLLAITNDSTRWREAHHAFDKLRDSLLELERNPRALDQQEIIINVLGLAELVAKVLYNATNPLDPFDDDSGWWIATCLRAVLDALNDDSSSARTWSAISGIRIDECHRTNR